MHTIFSRNAVQTTQIALAPFFKERCKYFKCLIQQFTIDIPFSGGIQNFTAFIQYSDDFRTLRRYTSQILNSRDHVGMYPLLQGQVKILLNNLLEDPQKFDEHLDRRVFRFSTVTRPAILRLHQGWPQVRSSSRLMDMKFARTTTHSIC